jgi:hypothetical protein
MSGTIWIEFGIVWRGLKSNFVSVHTGTPQIPILYIELDIAISDLCQGRNQKSHAPIILAMSVCMDVRGTDAGRKGSPPLTTSGAKPPGPYACITCCYVTLCCDTPCLGPRGPAELARPVSRIDYPCSVL